MPNWVYNSISVEEQYADKLKEIAKVGLARYYKPMPDELQGTTSPQRVDTPDDLIEVTRLTELYGCADWYTWANRNWGTKWGCCENDYNDGVYTYSTAWSPLDGEILYLLSQDIPNFHYTWEEEQGFGQEFEVVDGELMLTLEWEIPNFEETEHNSIWRLTHRHESLEGTFEVGYYEDGILTEFLSTDYDEAVQVFEGNLIEFVNRSRKDYE